MYFYTDTVAGVRHRDNYRARCSSTKSRDKCIRCKSKCSADEKTDRRSIDVRTEMVSGGCKTIYRWEGTGRYIWCLVVIDPLSSTAAVQSLGADLAMYR